MSVRAKCKVMQKSDYLGYAQDKATGKYAEAKLTRVELQPVSSSGENDPNKSWSEATPSGKIELSITNPEAVAAFELGKSYFVDFTPAE